VASNPRSEPIGYDAALSLGVTAMENGYSAAALPYLERAASLRPGRYVLVQLAKAQRDQGKAKEARATLLAARERPDGEDGHVLVSLAAILCDLDEHGAALEVALAAWQSHPEDAATLNILARTMREITGSLSKHDHIDPTALQMARLTADTVAKEARAATGPETVDFREVRRRRAQAHLGPPAPHPIEGWAPLEQQTGQPLTEPMPQLTDGPVTKEDQDLSMPGQEPSAPRAWWRRVLAAVGLRPD
jgi:hypothetical protein